jgi:uncharacterized protein (TIGR00299 family) protein
MKGLYFDLIGGASGDMILGSLIDAGLPIEKLRDELEGLKIPEFEIMSTRVEKNGFSAVKVDVSVTEQPPERHLDEITDIIRKSSLSDFVKKRALTIFNNIAQTEAGIHNLPVEQVHLHELGGTDTIIDVTGTLIGLEILEISSIFCSPIPLGKGFIKGAHGQIPLPSPATIALLKGVPVFGREIEAELVTPTGAAILVELAEDYCPPPPMVVQSIGYGAGGRDLPVPNLLRVLVGEFQGSGSSRFQRLLVLETNLDDLNPEIFPYVVDRLFAEGALDVTMIPIQMKKNRPGTQIQVLCNPSDGEKLKSILFHETTTLGIKQYHIDRYALARRIVSVSTKFGDIQVKVALTDQGAEKISPEYEDCRELAEKLNLPITKIYQEALQSYQDSNKE